MHYAESLWERELRWEQGSAPVGLKILRQEKAVGPELLDHSKILVSATWRRSPGKQETGGRLLTAESKAAELGGR